MMQAMVIRTKGDVALSGALAEGMIALENKRLKQELEEARLIIDHQLTRIERYNAQRLGQYNARPKPSTLRRFWGLLVERVDEDGGA